MLDGGFNAWQRKQLPTTRDAGPARQSNWTGTREASRLATWRDVKAALGRRDAVLLDTRTDGEYFGTTIRA
jgi:thiosulfate/3-mercaptopyruvate sulfurtransferase